MKYQGNDGDFVTYKDRETAQKATNQARDFLIKNKPLMRKYYDGAAEVQQMFVNEDIYLAQTWSGPASKLIMDGQPIELSVPKESTKLRSRVVQGSPAYPLKSLTFSPPSSCAVQRSVLQSTLRLRAFLRVRDGASGKAIVGQSGRDPHQTGLPADGDGLYLVVDASGARRWAFIYHAQGKRREMGLGRMGLKQAREAADEVRRQIRTGLDPILARRTARDTRAAIPTFEAIAREVINEAQAKSTNDKVRYQWELLLGPTYCGSILKKPINEITTLDVEKVLRPVWRTKPETGRKLLIRLRRVFDYARVHLRDKHGIGMPANPAAWEDLRDRGFERITKLSRGRQAALDYPQVPEVLKALRARKGIAARALEATLLTGLPRRAMSG
jgi:hypothetical protein